jgi:hypothetical protein
MAFFAIVGIATTLVMSTLGILVVMSAVAKSLKF